MKLIVILSVLTVGMCAPLGETEQAVEINDVDSDEIRVKRAKEIMMFGNEQNEIAKGMEKRVDPSIDQDGKVDRDGLIVAKEPQDLPNESSETAIDTNAETSDTVSDETESGVTSYQESNELNEDSTEEDEVPVDNTEVALTGEEANEDEMSFEDYLKELEKIKGGDAYEADYLSSLVKDSVPQYGGWQQPSYGLFNYPSYGKYGRYRRSQTRTFNGYPYQAARMLKRGHRAKRQTYDPEDVGVYLPYGMKYNYPVDEDDMAELLDLLDTPGPYDDTDRFVSPYETYSPYEEPNELEFESPIYVPPKRQAGLTFVPGIKRSRDFYPYFEEPDTHFGAFIPEKRSMREYADAYQRVMELAAELRQQEEAYPGDYFEGYRRRK